MFEKRYPVFLENEILKADMLTTLADNMVEYMEQYFGDYSDGILSGLVLNINKSGKLELGKGLIKFKGNIYRLIAPVTLPLTADGNLKLIKLRFGELVKEEDFMVSDSECFFDTEEKLQDNEVELGRFTLKEGASLRQDYQNLKDFATIHNTINRIHVLYSDVNHSTISPDFTTYFGLNMLEYDIQDPWDVAFAMKCVSRKPVSKELICKYVNRKLRKRLDVSCSNYDMYQALVMILEQSSHGSRGFRNSSSGGRKIIVD